MATNYWYKTVTSRGITLPLRSSMVPGGFLVEVVSGEYAGKSYLYRTTSTRASALDASFKQGANEISYQIIPTRITIEEYEETVAPAPEEVVPTVIPEEEIPPEAPPTALPEENEKKYLKCTLPFLDELPGLPWPEDLDLPVPPGFELVDEP